ncbi:MAG: tetratricopeptide repeat protein, partial [Planctomycetota bacterium]
MFSSTTRPFLNRVRWLITLIALTAITLVDSRAIFGQSPNDEREQKIAERFEQVLRQRPSRGTALDYVYQYRLRRGTLDALIESLTGESLTGESLTGDDSLDAADQGRASLLAGLILTKRGDDKSAVKWLESAEAKLSDNATVSYELGKALVQVGETTAACEAFERAIDRGPSRQVASKLFTDLGRLYMRTGQTENANEVWKRAEVVFPNDTRVQILIAETLAEEAESAEAMRRFDWVARTASSPGERIRATIRAADMQCRMGDSGGAVTRLDGELANLRPGSWLHQSVQQHLETIFERSGKIEDLLKFYEAKIDKNPQDLSLRFRLAATLAAQGELEGATETLFEALERAPSNTELRERLIDLCRRQNRTEAIVQQYEQLAVMDPSNAEYALRWGDALLNVETMTNEERKRAASIAWSGLAQRRGGDAVILAKIADRYRQIGRNDQAIDLYQKAIAANPASKIYHQLLGGFLWELERHEDAIATWESMLDGDPNNVENQIRLAEIFDSKPLQEKADAAWRAVSKLDLSFQQCRRVLLAFDSRDEAAQPSEITQQTIRRLLRMAESVEESAAARDLWLDWLDRHGRLKGVAEQLASSLESNSPIDVDGVPWSLNDRYLILSSIRRLQNRLDEASRLLETAIEKFSSDARLFVLDSDLAERQSLWEVAAQRIEKAAVLQPKRASVHYARAIQLRLRLGQIDQSLQLAQNLIDAQPAAIGGYLQFAQIAFENDRDDDGVRMLNRAIAMAPRNPEPRQRLAQHFADEYETEKAIQAYWQMMALDVEMKDKMQWVESLASLSLRADDLESVIRRLRSEYADEPRAADLFVAAAYREAELFVDARQTLERMPAHLDDPILLAQLVQVCRDADEIDDAIAYQQKLTEMTDSVAERSQLVRMRLIEGDDNISPAELERLIQGISPAGAFTVVRKLYEAKKFDSAIRLCESAIKQDDSLWDFKLLLAQLLLEAGQFPLAAENETPGKSEPNPHERIESLAKQIIGVDQELDTGRPSRAAAVQGFNAFFRSSATSGRRVSSTTLADYVGIAVYEYGLGLFESWRRQDDVDLVEFRNLGQAKLLASLFVTVSRHQRGTLDKKAVADLADEFFPIPMRRDELLDPKQYWLHRAFRESIGKTGDEMGERFTLWASSDDDRFWEVAAQAPLASSSAMLEWLSCRKPDEDTAVPTDASSETIAKKDVKPLSKRQLETLLEIEAAMRPIAKAHQSPRQRGSDFIDWLRLREYLSQEATRSGDAKSAAAHFVKEVPRWANAWQSLRFMHFHLGTADLERLRAGMRRFAQLARNGETWQLDPYFGLFDRQRKGLADDLMPAEDRLRWMDLGLARNSAVKEANNANVGEYGSGEASGHAWVGNDKYLEYQLPVPLSVRLLDSDDIAAMISALGDSCQAGGRKDRIRLTPKQWTHLEKRPPDATDWEWKRRRVLAAFVCWWRSDLTECYRRIETLAKEFPDDADMQLEYSRLASESGDDTKAMEILLAIQARNGNMLVRKEYAVLNLATRLDQPQRAKLSADRLAGVRLDRDTQFGVVNRLNDLGLESEAERIMSRLRQTERSAASQIRIAREYLRKGQSETASEIAREVLREVTRRAAGASGNSPFGIDPCSDAVAILQETNEFDQFLRQATDRAERMRQSVHHREVLFHLYTAADDYRTASQIYESIERMRSNSEVLFQQKIEALIESRRYQEAIQSIRSSSQANAISNGYRAELLNRCLRNQELIELALSELQALPESVFPEQLVLSLTLRNFPGSVPSDAHLKALETVFSRRDLNLEDLQRLWTDASPKLQSRVDFPGLLKSYLKQNDLFSDAETWDPWWNSDDGIYEFDALLEKLIESCHRDPEFRDSLIKVCETAKQDLEHQQAASLLKLVIQHSSAEGANRDRIWAQLDSWIDTFETSTSQTNGAKPNNFVGRDIALVRQAAYWFAAQPESKEHL